MKVEANRILVQISGLSADSSDAEWSINIKKGLASTLQVDHSTGDEFGKDENAFMRTVEVFGCEVEGSDVQVIVRNVVN